MVDLALLKMLADGKFHSGTSLGVALGLSRSAVWEADASAAGIRC